MQRVLTFVFFVLVLLASTAKGQSYEAIQGYCEQGGERVITDGRQSTTRVQRSYPSCTITVYNTGTLTLATIASDNSGTPKANPFTADTDGYFKFYVQAGRYDYKMSGGGLTTPVTRSGVWVSAGGGGGSGITGSGTVNRVSIFTGTNAIGNSVFEQVGTSEIKFSASGKRVNLDTGSALVVEVANASVTGTTLNRVAKLTGAPSTAVVAGTTDTSGVLGIVVAGSGTTGSAQIGVSGTVTCEFDGATTAGNYVKVSTTVAGKCSDAGATVPTSGVQILGRVLSTNLVSGTYSVLLFGPGSHVSQLGGAGTNQYVALWSGTNTLTTATDFFRDAPNTTYVFQDNVAINTTEASSKLSIDTDQIVLEGSATRPNASDMVTLKATATQTGDFLDATNSAGVSKFRIDIDGDALIRGVNYSWPTVGASGYLFNNGSNVLTWNSASVTGVRQALNAVLDYGAVGDGVTDDTSALQNCINASGASGGKICYLPATSASYKVTGLTWIAQAHLVGDGPTKSVISSTNNAAIIDVATTASQSSIRGIGITGSVSAGSSQVGLSFGGSADYNNVSVSDVKIMNTGSYGLYNSRAFSSTWEKLEFQGTQDYPILFDANDKPGMVLSNIYLKDAAGTLNVAIRVKGGDVICYNCNGIEPGDSGSTLWAIGKKAGVDGDVANQTASFECFGCNLEAWDTNAYISYYNSPVSCYACTIYPSGGATSGKRVGNYDVDSASFPAYLSRGTIDELTIIDGPESGYANGQAFHGNDQPPLVLEGLGPRVLTGSTPGRVTTYRDTTNARSNPLGRADGSFVIQTVTGTTSYTRTGPRYIQTNCSAPCTITVPWAGYYRVGELLIIKDIAGNAATHNVTINSNGGGTVNGSSFVLNINGQSVILAPDTSGLGDWRVVGVYGTAASTPSLTSTRIGYGDGSNLLTGSADFTFDATNRVVTLTRSGAGTQIRLTGTTDTNQVRFGSGGHAGSGQGLILPFVGSNQSNSNGITWSDGTYGNMNSIWLNFGFNFQGASSAHDLIKFRTGTGLSSDGSVRFQFEPSQSLYTQTGSVGNTNTAYDGNVVDFASTGTAAAGFGFSNLVKLENGSGSQVNASRITTTWTTATAGSETSKVAIANNVAGGGVADSFAVEGDQYYGTVYAKGNVSGSVTLDFNLGNTVTMTLTNNITGMTFSNIKAGANYRLKFTQDATGSRTFTPPTTIKIPGGVVSNVLTLTANAVDWFDCVAIDTTNLWCNIWYDVKNP